jgi:replicative DNA helicase
VTDQSDGRPTGPNREDVLELEWEMPVPLLTHPAPPAFPLDALSLWAREWVVEISAEKGASPDIGANLLLAVVSGALARDVQVSPRPGWYEPTNLFEITGLAPGQRKTLVFKEALRPVRTLERRRIIDHTENARAAALAQQLFEKHERDLLREASPEDEIEALLARLGERPPDPGPAPRLLTEDVTPEKLAALIGDHGRIIVASDEGSALVENLAGRYYAHGGSSWDLFNKAHAGSDFVVDRKGSPSVIVFDPALTIAITTQPTLLRSIASKRDVGERGVLARPLYSLPRPVFADGPTPQARQSVLDQYGRRITNLFSDVPELQIDEDGHPRPAILQFAVDARVEFERWEQTINDERQRLGEDEDGDGLVLGWISKLAGHTARLAAVLHAASHWTNGSAATTTIDLETTRRAIAIADYFWKHALIAFGLMGELPVQKRARSILRWLRTRGLEQTTVRDIHRSRGRGTTAEQVRDALRLLEDHGYVRLQRRETGRPGQPAHDVFVHPKIAGFDPTHPTETPSHMNTVGPVGPIQADLVANGRPLIGDKDYPEALLAAVNASLIDEAEARQALDAHKLIVTVNGRPR